MPWGVIAAVEHYLRQHQAMAHALIADMAGDVLARKRLRRRRYQRRYARIGRMRKQ